MRRPSPGISAASIPLVPSSKRPLTLGKADQGFDGFKVEEGKQMARSAVTDSIKERVAIEKDAQSEGGIH